MTRSFIFFLLAGLSVSACSREHQETFPAADSHFTDFYARTLILKEEGKILGTDSTHLKARLDSLRTNYQLRKEYVDSLIAVYQSDLHRWKQFNESVLKRLETIQREEGNTAHP